MITPKEVLPIKYFYSVIPMTQEKGKGDEPVEGFLEADTLEEARENLRSQGYYIYDLHEQTYEDTARMYLKNLSKKDFSSNISHTELAETVRQLASMIDTNLPLAESLTNLSALTRNKGLSQSLLDAAQRVREGFPLSIALSEQSCTFPRFLIAMTAAGEQAGGDTLPKILLSAANYIGRTGELDNKFRSASIYPLVTVTIILLAAMVILAVVIPNFAEMYKSTNTPLPPLSKALFSVSDFVRSYWLLLLPGVSVPFFLLKYLKTIPGFARLAFHIPGLGKFLKTLSLARFTTSMATLINGGATIGEALNIAIEALNNPYLERDLKPALQSVEEGKGITPGLAQSAFLPPSLKQAIAIGESTGDLGLILEKQAKHYENELDILFNTLSSLLQPILIAPPAIILLVLIIGAYFPIIELINGITQSR